MYVIYARACACRGAWLQGEVSRRQCHGAVIVPIEAAERRVWCQWFGPVHCDVCLKR